MAKASKKRGSYKKAQARIADQKETILKWLSKSFSKSAAIARAGISFQQFKKWEREDTLFAQMVEDAIDIGTDTLEDVATGRAKRKSDILLMFLLKSRNAKFRQEQSPNAGVVEVRVKKF